MSELKLELVPVTAPSEPAFDGPAVGKSASEEAPQQSPQATLEQPSPSVAPPESGAHVPWRQWSSFDRTTSFRLPPELLDELEERMWRLRLPRGAVGLTVAAALTLLLDESDDRLLELVGRAESAKPRRRRMPEAST